MPNVIQTNQLTKRFGTFTAVDRVTFSVESGEVVGILGPNGSGKTTTIRMLLGLLLPSQGEARVLGYDVATQSEQIRTQIGYMSQKFTLYRELTVEENLTFYAGIYGVRDRKRLEEVLAQVALSELRDERVSNLSTGWRQRLGLATAIIHRPKLLFLDEPTSGVDPTARRAFWDLIYVLVEEDVTAVVTTHYMDEAEYCGKVGIMRAGQMLAMDTPAALRKHSISGRIFEISAEPLLLGLDTLENLPGILHARLAGNHLNALTEPHLDRSFLQNTLRQAGLSTIQIERVEPTLEDVFLALAEGLQTPG